MLSEIICERLHQKKIICKPGLNVVLGTDIGDNSIGKSSFLLLIDFIFGGKTYANSKDIIENVGFHEIYFKFIFDKNSFYFSRHTKSSNEVWRCDEKYSKVKLLSLDEYCSWLALQYKIDLYELSFRNAVSRYIRVYEKNNCDEKHPLNSFPQEKQENAVISLIKLFDKYQIINELSLQVSASQKKIRILKNAQAEQYVSHITKQQYKNNQKEIKRLQSEIDEMSRRLNQNLLALDSVISEEALEIKRQLSRVKRMQSSEKSKLLVFNDNENCIQSFSQCDISQLHIFFPTANIKHINEIEQFHIEIQDILLAELENEKFETQKKIESYGAIISELEGKLKALITNPNISKSILQQHSQLIKEITRLENENLTYERLENLKTQNKSNTNRLKDIQEEQLTEIENKINDTMRKINDSLYSENHNAPVLRLNNKTYKFFTPNDTGTGIAYKGLVVYDLSILQLTALPVIVHDSLILKQISDDAIEKILLNYSAARKQVFIALDKQRSYSAETFSLLNDNSILKLAKGGQELFGKFWGNEHPHH